MTTDDWAVAPGNGANLKPSVTETFSLVIKPATTHLILALTTTQYWCLRQLDINNATLEGTLMESRIYVTTTGFYRPFLSNSHMQAQ